MYDYNTLRNIVGEFLGYGRAIDAWSVDATDQVDYCIQRGYTQFLFPPPIDGRNKRSHRWRFLKPLMTVDIVAGQNVYPLRPDFTRLVGPLTYATEDTGYRTLSQASIGQILDFRQRIDGDVTADWPTHYATQPQDHKGVDQQRWEMHLWPDPSTSLTLTAPIAINPLPLSEKLPHHYGDAFHGDTILESCLSIAEQYLDDNAGVHTAKWKERLIASVDHDSRNAPKTLGYNGNGPKDTPWNRSINTTYKSTLY